MKKISSSFLFILFSVALVFSQDDIYFTQHATLVINGGLNQKPLKLSTNELTIKLDYETTEITVRFRPATLESTNDTLNQLLRNKQNEVVFSGDLDLEFINTQKHPPLDFGFQGWLEFGDIRRLIKGKGVLHHIGDSDRVACMMGLTINLNLEDLNVELPDVFGKEIEVVVTDALLQKDKY